jgi:hypothetical protein
MAGPDGRFRIDRLRAGEAVRLRALGEGEQDAGLRWPKEPDSVEAKPGDSNVVLVVDDRSVVRVRVDGVPAGASVPWTLTTRLAPPLFTQMQHFGSVTSDGVLRFNGLDPALRHGLLVGPTRDGLVGFADGLVPGGPDVVVRLALGNTLTGRVEMPAGVGARDVTVTAFGELWRVQSDVDTAGAFRFEGLPPGNCNVVASALSRDGRSFAGSVQTTTAGDVTVSLQATPAAHK